MDLTGDLKNRNENVTSQKRVSLKLGMEPLEDAWDLAARGIPPSQTEIEAEKMDFIQQCFDKGMTEESRG